MLALKSNNLRELLQFLVSFDIFPNFKLLTANLYRPFVVVKRISRTEVGSGSVGYAVGIIEPAVVCFSISSDFHILCIIVRKGASSPFLHFFERL